MNAESLTTAFESSSLDELWAERAAAAKARIAAERAAAEDIIFSRKLERVTDDDIARYAELIARCQRPGYTADMADFHERAYPELQLLFRSRECLQDVGLAAARGAFPADHRETHAAAEARAFAAAVAQYQRLIAEQLRDSPDKSLSRAARTLLECEALQARLDAAVACREEHARAELARAEVERRAAARAVLDKTVERVRAAEAAAADARAKAELSAREYRHARADAFAERLRLSGLSLLHVDRDGAPFEVADLLANARNMSIESLDRFEQALAKHEAA